MLPTNRRQGSDSAMLQIRLSRGSRGNLSSTSEMPCLPGSLFHILDRDRTITEHCVGLVHEPEGDKSHFSSIVDRSSLRELQQSLASQVKLNTPRRINHSHIEQFSPKRSPPIERQDEWLAARKQLLEQDKVTDQRQRCGQRSSPTASNSQTLVRPTPSRERRTKRSMESTRAIHTDCGQSSSP